MTPELRAALRLVVEAHPVGSSVTLPREHVLDLLDAEPLSGPALEQDLTCKRAGAILGRHDSTVRGMCERGELAGAYRQNGREWRIPATAVQAYQVAQRSGKTPIKTSGRRSVDLGSWRKVRAS